MIATATCRRTSITGRCEALVTWRVSGGISDKYARQQFKKIESIG
jgi:hypothetical protein